MTTMDQFFIFLGALGICAAIYLWRVRVKKRQDTTGKSGGGKPGGPLRR